MFSLMENLWPRLCPPAYTLKIEALESYINMSKAEEWHLYAIRCRHQRPHVCVACAWLAKSLGRGARIFEAGCGSGINLLWLGSKGFHNLYGADLSQEAVCLGKYLARHLDLPLSIWQDNSLEPKKVPHDLDGLISLNWLYHLPNVSLGNFLETYKRYLAPDARMVFDMVDASYNNCKNNEYHTDDFGLPKARRRASEYPLRLSRDEVIAIVESHGLRVARSANVWGPVPRTVWLVENKTN
ncbi:MAG: methyltransferase domain-containing protein [Desulfovibrio sp.]|jgi:SAM-dependent methyltransferase|nr:methyltransferase domain-containing protein [Desulfovibrio sp.]